MFQKKKQNLVGVWMNTFDMTESTCCWHGARRPTAPDGLVETDVTEKTLALKIPDFFGGGRAKFRNSQQVEANPCSAVVTAALKKKKGETDVWNRVVICIAQRPLNSFGVLENIWCHVCRLRVRAKKKKKREGKKKHRQIASNVVCYLSTATSLHLFRYEFVRGSIRRTPTFS